MQGVSQLTHNVVTTLLERCSLVRSDLTFRQRPHDVRRVTTYITTLYERFSNVTLQRYVEVLTQRCHNVVRTSCRSYNSRVISGYLHNVVTALYKRCSAALFPSPGTTLSQRCTNVVAQRYLRALAQRCHNVV